MKHKQMVTYAVIHIVSFYADIIFWIGHAFSHVAEFLLEHSGSLYRANGVRISGLSDELNMTMREVIDDD